VLRGIFFYITLPAALWPWSTQSLKETIPGSKGLHCVGLTTVQPSSANCLEPSGPVQACTGVVYLYFVPNINTREYGVPYAYFKERLLMLNLKLTLAV